MSSARICFARPKGFTLVELLAAITIVVVLMAAVIGILSSATLITGQSRKLIDADSEAREIFGRMTEDFAGMIKRPDLDYIFAKSTGNDTLYFYSEAPALAEPSSTYANTCALVGYRINSQYQLERLGKGLALGLEPPAGMVFLSYASLGAPQSPDPNSTFANPLWTPLLGSAPTYGGDPNGNDASSTYFHVLGDAVFRFEYCFLLKPYKQPTGVVLPAVYSNYPYDTRAGHGPELYGIGPADIQAIVVAVAILDLNSRKLVSTANLQTLASDLPDPQDSDLSGSPPQLMAQLWNKALTTTAFAGVLKTAAGNVHLYQRTFFLEPYLN